MKYSALKIEWRDLKGWKDDSNQILSVHGFKLFTPHEQLFYVFYEREEQYNEYLPQLREILRNDFRKYPNDTVFRNEIFIAVTLVFLEYPSRLD